MTTPEKDEERVDARIEAERALAEAQRKIKRGKTLAEAWRQSRQDNNFRLMLRDLTGRGN